MKIKKKIAGILATVMLLNTTQLVANVQERLPMDGISPIVVSHTTNTGTGNIMPNAQVTFKRATNSTNSTVVGETNRTEAEFYYFHLNSSLGTTINSDRIDGVLGKETYVENVEDYINNINDFKNGTLYKLEVIPGHWHADAQGLPVLAPLSGTSSNPSKFFLTDFDTIMRESNDQIEVLWEYIPGATYELVYIDRDVSTKAGVDGTDGSIQSGVGSQRVTLTERDVQLVTEGGVRKAKYVLPNTIPGQKYSAYVMVKSLSSSFLTDKWENVGKNTDTPKIARASRSVTLTISNIGRQRIELRWQLGSWADNNTLKTTKIYRKTEGETSFTLIGTLDNTTLNPPDPGRFEHDEPNRNSTYYVEFIFTGPNGNESLLTKEVLYVPYELREQPLKPQVPEPYSDSVREAEDFRKDDYLVSGDDISIDQMKPNTFHMSSKNPLEIQLVWDAPTLKDGSIEYGLKYDVWLVEDEQMLSDAKLEPLIKDLGFSEGVSDGLIYKQDNRTVVGFKTLLNQYINSSGMIKSLIANKTYYIKIVAKRDYSGIYMTSQPTTVAITVDKNGDIFTPPVLAKPPLRIQENGILTNSIAIEWLETWYEITANNPDYYTDEDEKYFASLWNSKVYTGGTPSIKFQSEEGLGLVEHILKTRTDLTAVQRIVGSSYSQDYRDREVTLGADVKYEVKTLLYDDVIAQIKANNANIITTASALTIEKWIVQNESSSTNGWNTIAPESVNHSDGLDWKGHVVSGLQSNTRYIVLIRAYRELDSGEKLTQTFPSYVIGTTTSDYIPPETIPTVPTLNPNGTTDESVSVWWTYNEDFNYEIVYSRLEDPNTATSWPVQISNNPGEANYVSNGAKATVTITGLTPETTYNVWIRATQKTGTEVSAWSNPVTQTTLSINTPDAPRGLGPAAYQSILGLGLDFRPIGSDYLTVEWLKDTSDVEVGGMANKVYSYVVEFAGNPEFLDSISFDTSGQAVTDVQILDKTTVRFDGLEANMPYYVRVKTVLTYTNPETGVQIIRESDFTSYVRILTRTSDEEYDGGENENIVIYPNAIEETYINGTWTYELVDTAKLITQIQNANKYYFTITMNNYQNKYDAKVRRIKMPKNIVDTLSNKGMALKIITNIGEYEIPGTSLNYYLKQHSATDSIYFELTRMEYSDVYSYIRSYPDLYQQGERLEIKLQGSNKKTEVTKLDGMMRVKLKMSSLITYNTSTLLTYQYNYAAGTWNQYPYEVDSTDNSYLGYSTAYTGLNALYQRSMAGNTSAATSSMNQLASAYNITGLGTTYNKNQLVGASQYVTLLLGISQNKSRIDLTQAASQSDYTKASTAGLYMSNSRGDITKEQAIAGLVKLYELKNGYAIKPSNVTFSNVSSNYKQAVAKAYAIGLISNGLQGAQGTVTYAQLCDWLLQIV